MCFFSVYNARLPDDLKKYIIKRIDSVFTLDFYSEYDIINLIKYKTSAV